MEHYVYYISVLSYYKAKNLCVFINFDILKGSYSFQTDEQL